MTKCGAIVRLLCPAAGLLIAGLVGTSCQMHSSRSDQISAANVSAASAPLGEAELASVGLEELWYIPADRGANHVVSASLVDGLFVATEPSSRRGKLMRVDRDTGKTLWAFDLNATLTRPPSVYRFPAGTEGRPDEVYFTQLDTVFVLDYKYGDLLRSNVLAFSVSTGIAAVEDRYFVGSDDENVYGVSKTLQTEEWRHRTGGGLQGKPIVAGNGLIAASRDGSVYRLSTVNGWNQETGWSFETSAPIVADPVVYSQWVLVGSMDYKLYCLSLRDGSRAWDFLAESPIEQAPVVYSYRPGQDVVLCIGVDRSSRRAKHTLFAVDLASGEPMWRSEGVRQVVSLGRDNLYVLNDPSAGKGRTLTALNILTGKERFQLDVSEFHFAPTNLADFGRNRTERGQIFLVAKNGAIQAITEKF
jgi:outer membrane protein assembly factor BamB